MRFAPFTQRLLQGLDQRDQGFAEPLPGVISEVQLPIMRKLDFRSTWMGMISRFTGMRLVVDVLTLPVAAA
jgi:hypothetical protein